MKEQEAKKKKEQVKKKHDRKKITNTYKYFYITSLCLFLTKPLLELCSRIN